jgi:predicted short-subunit dehydrogenase-like oxidoreductase (DUF2520 family)
MVTKNPERLKRVVFIGAGNVAVHLAKALKQSGNNIVQIYSRSLISARQLAEKTGASFTDDIKQIRKDCDLYIFALPDHALTDVIKNGSFNELFLVHTAGSVPMDIFSGITARYGVIYPLQTLSKNIETDFRNVPLCIEGSKPECLANLTEISSSISGMIRTVTSEERKKLHLAAVFACNFTNFMYTLASGLLVKQGLPFEILYPLITETARKACQGNPSELQTGPAIRNDQTILQMHKEMLDDSPALKELYIFVTNSIISYYHNQQNSFLIKDNE